MDSGKVEPNVILATISYKSGGTVVPANDVLDFTNGARFIPGPVTRARREGKEVDFITKCGPNCWYWLFPDGGRQYHFALDTYFDIGRANGRKLVNKNGINVYPERLRFDGDGYPGSCPRCGNVFTNGETLNVVVDAHPYGGAKGHWATRDGVGIYCLSYYGTITSQMIVAEIPGQHVDIYR